MKHSSFVGDMAWFLRGRHAIRTLKFSLIAIHAFQGTFTKSTLQWLTTVPHTGLQLAVFQGKVILHYDFLEAEVGVE